ncbi:DUF2142 domain-containing protein [Erysipelatoclostridium sp. An173]|uniref:DUF2142 domain-containing protein n=1 Tax=Erysipelatoclostridium sp. An173 TaxID=1965571 RepID=UPI003207A028
MKPSIYKGNKKTFIIISLIIVLISVLITYVYINPKLGGDALFDQNNILKDQWSTLEKGKVINNQYAFTSENSKLSSIVVVVQNLDEKLNGTVRATVYNKNNGQLLIEKEKELLPNTQSYDFKIDINENESIENIVIKLENISDNNNIKTRITDTDNIEEEHLAYRIYSTMPNFVSYFVYGIIIIVDMMIILGIYLTLARKITLEKIFLVVGIICGITYTMLFTPGTIPDETTHIRNTLGYSSILLSEGTSSNIVIRECEQFIGDTQPSIKTLNTYRNLLIENNNSNKYIETDVELSSDFSVISYLPGIIMVTICRLLSIGGILTIYLARFSNFVFYLLAGYFSIKKIPIFKIVLFTLSLLPMVIQQTISLSYDTIILATSWLVISYGFHFVYGNESINKKDIIIYIISSCVLITQKTGIYFVLNLIPLLIGKNRVAEKKERIILKLILTFPWIITMIGLPMITNNNRIEKSVSNGNIVSWANKEGYSMAYFMDNKMETVMLFIRTIVKKFDHYVFTTLGQYLGSLNLILSRNIFIGWLISVFVAAFKTDSDKKDIMLIHKILYIFAFLAVCGASILAMAFAFTPVGWPTIEGVQGRYFLPVLFLLVIFVRNKKIIFKKNYDRYFVMWVIILQGVTIINIIGQILIV